MHVLYNGFEWEFQSVVSCSYVLQYLEYIGFSCVVPHFAKMRNICSLYYHVLGIIWKQETHPEGCIMAK